MPQTQTPSNTLSVGDPGDDTGRRFDYQHAYAAIVACGLLEEPPVFSEVFCEHHEDVLVRHEDGHFQGIQVKTRSEDGEPWKASDEQIVGALCRFAKLEAAWPNCFVRFVIATNHHFYEGGETKTNLKYLLGLAQDATDEAHMPPKLPAYVAKLARASGRSNDETLRALKKTACDSTLPKLDDIKRRLRETISSVYPPARNAVPRTLAKAADELVSEMRRAASLDHRDTLPGYLSALLDSRGREVTERIAGKRLDRQRLESVLQEAIALRSLLCPGGQLEPPSSTEPANRLEQKLAAGGLSVVSINSAKDLQAAALGKFFEWQNCLGDEEALKRYAHLKTMVLADCAAAHEATRRDDQPFGRAMLGELKRRLQQRREANDAPTFDCLCEHMEGFSYELTNACKVWWSEPFELNSET